MKKLLITLIALSIITPCFAQVKTTTRIQKEVSDACRPILTTDTLLSDFMACLANNFENPYMWRLGWEKPVTWDVLSVIDLPKFADARSMSTEEKLQMAEILRQSLTKLFRDTAITAKQNNVGKMPPDMVQNFK